MNFEYVRKKNKDVKRNRRVMYDGELMKIAKLSITDAVITKFVRGMAIIDLSQQKLQIVSQQKK